MKVGISGASGLIGSALIKTLAGEGHQMAAFGRTPYPNVRFTSWDLLSGPPPSAELEGLDAFFHLAGTPIAEGRWTAERKRLIRDSRIQGTRHLVEALGRCRKPPDMLVSASAVGYYGSRGEDTLSEDSSSGEGFLPELCQEWEAQAQAAERLGIRVILMRTGVVLSTAGGALARMLPAFKLGAAGRLGSGSQFMPWIHIDDMTGLLRFVLEHAEVSGPVNATAPEPVTNREFTRTLAGILGRPALLAVPATALKIALGEMAGILLEGQRVLPRKALSAGYQFGYPRLQDALAQLLRKR